MCLGPWGYRGMYALIAISRLCQEESLKGLKDQRQAFSHSANYYGDYPGNNPENHPPAESCTINSKLKKFKHLMLAMGPRDLNSAPYSPVHCSSHSMTSFQSSELTELPVVENSQLFAQRTVRPLSMGQKFGAVGAMAPHRYLSNLGGQGGGGSHTRTGPGRPPRACPMAASPRWPAGDGGGHRAAQPPLRLRVRREGHLPALPLPPAPSYTSTPQ